MDNTCAQENKDWSLRNITELHFSTTMFRRGKVDEQRATWEGNGGTEERGVGVEEEAEGGGGAKRETKFRFPRSFNFTLFLISLFPLGSHTLLSF